jgi:hypothetical protein
LKLVISSLILVAFYYPSSFTFVLEILKYR